MCIRVGIKNSVAKDALTSASFLRIFHQIIVMAPACVIGKQPQSFAIPYHAADSKDDGVYLTPLLRLSQIGAELTRLAYSTPNPIVSWAIVEEDVITEGGPPDTDRWLVLARSRPLRLLEFRTWLSKRVPTEVDLDRMVPLTTMLQRRFGWGDVRTTPELHGGAPRGSASAIQYGRLIYGSPGPGRT